LIRVNGEYASQILLLQQPAALPFLLTSTQRRTLVDVSVPAQGLESPDAYTS
jgi:hypothetical protein